ncbi:MAG: SDR family oxidoreductase [Alistipes sp.]|nr:SDR family oxidoreductase [Alistipes sp.]
MDFKGKTVVITGASSGIGLALARGFSASGANVVAGARSGEKLSALKAELESQGGKIAARSTDVTKQEDCKELIAAAVEAFGGIDILICNAGISMRAILDDLELSVLHRLMDVNFWGTVYCTKFALPYLQASRGSIVGVSSVAGIHGLPGRTGYSASKYAMTGFLETVRIENLKKGLHVMIACQVFTASNVLLAALTADVTSQGETPRDEARMMSAEEAAQRIMKGVSGRKRTVLMDFNGRATTFIKKFAPSFLDKMFYDHMAKEPDSPLR